MKFYPVLDKMTVYFGEKEEEYKIQSKAATQNLDLMLLILPHKWSWFPLA